jgi:thioredoxin 1
MKQVIKFSASWCGPCKMLDKTLSTIETNTPITVVDIDEQSSLAAEYGIRSVPTLVMIDDDGNVSKRITGNQPAEKLKEWLNG